MYGRPTEAVREGGSRRGSEGRREGYVDGMHEWKDAWMGTSMQGCMDTWITLMA